MRIMLLFICFLVSISSFSQDLIAGFYQVSFYEDGFALKDTDSDKLIYLRPQPIIILEDVVRIWSGRIPKDITHSLSFKLNENGAKKTNDFSQNKGSAKIGLVLEDRIVQTANWNTVITDMFSINGFEKKEAKKLRKKLNKAKLENKGNHYLYANDDFIIYKDRTVYKQTELYSSKTDVDAFVKREAIPDTKCDPVYKSYYNPLSLVGNFYSYEFGSTSEVNCV